MTTREHHLALREAHHIADSEAYFKARIELNTYGGRTAFEAGYQRGFDAAEKLYATQARDLEAKNQRLREALGAMQRHVEEFCAVYGFPLPRATFDKASTALEQQPPEPDAYCITTPDGGCISTNPRCMHQPQAEAAPAWTTEQITAVAQPIAMAIAENCRTAPQLVFPYLFLGLKDFLTSTAPQQVDTQPTTLQWCQDCGEGYVDFCRVKSNACKMKPKAE